MANLTGTPGPDTIIGTAGNDLYLVGAGDQAIEDLAGAAVGNNTLDGAGFADIAVIGAAPPASGTLADIIANNIILT